MSTSIHDDGRSPFALTPLPGVAAEPEPLFPVDPRLVVAEPPSLQDTLVAAALLWCTHAGWPTVSAIAACAGVSTSSVLWPFGTADQMRQALITAERAALEELTRAHDGDLPAAVDDRVEQLCVADVRLSRLPLIVAIAAGVHDPGELAVLAGAVRSDVAA